MWGGCSVCFVHKLQTANINTGKNKIHKKCVVLYIFYFFLSLSVKYTHVVYIILFTTAPLAPLSQ